jgi:hypothetical protein
MNTAAASAVDYSLGLSRTYFCTFENVVVDYNHDRRTAADPYYGHHGISIGRGRDNLISGFNIRAQQVSSEVVMEG